MTFYAFMYVERRIYDYIYRDRDNDTCLVAGRLKVVFLQHSHDCLNPETSFGLIEVTQITLIFFLFWRLSLAFLCFCCCRFLNILRLLITKLRCQLHRGVVAECLVAQYHIDCENSTVDSPGALPLPVKWR